MAQLADDPRETTSLARLDPQALIAKAIETGAGIETMERLVALAKEVRAVQAREAWYEAMAEFQRQCPAIKKTKRASIQTARASYSYTYAPLDEILAVIQPVMGTLGLSVSWRHGAVGDKITATCRISHTLGHHEESGEVSMPVIIADAERGANPMQRIGIATTYAKRYALLGIIGMAPEDDDDARSQAQDREPKPERQGPTDGQTIDEPRQRKFHAVARGHGWSDEQVHTLLSDHGIMSGSAKEIPLASYDALVDRLKAQPKK